LDPELGAVIRSSDETFPFAGNDTAASRQLNRRVEIILSDDNGNMAPRQASAEKFVLYTKNKEHYKGEMKCLWELFY